jgi:glutamate carboxypeptidase
MPRPLLCALLALSAGMTVPLQAQSALTPTERRIADYVAAHADEATGLLERIVNVNSGTGNLRGVREVGAILAPEFQGIGFNTRWVEMPDSMGRAGHLFAERTPGRAGRGKGKRLLLIGHLDTVFENDSTAGATGRFVREGTTARGPGVSDMKGGDVVIVYALKALASVGALDGTTITAAFTGDEENPGQPLSISRRDLVAAARRSDVALEFEGGARDSTREYATVARRSATGWTLRTGGVSAHSAGLFNDRVGSGAIFEAARILDEWHRELRGERYLTFNPGTILGGTTVSYNDVQARGTAAGKTNVVAQSAIVSGDLRTISDAQLASARQRMRAIVDRHLPQTTAEVIFEEGYPAMSPTAANRALLDLLNTANRALGYPEQEALDPGLRGAADVSFAAPYVGAALAGLGVHGAGSHTPEESVDLATMPRQIARAAILIYRLTHP